MPEPPSSGLSEPGDPAQYWRGRNNADREQVDGEERTLRKGCGHAPAADGRGRGRATRSNDLRRPGHEEVSRCRDRDRVRRALDAPRPRYEDPRADLRDFRCLYGTRAGTGPASAHGIASGLDRRGIDRNIAPSLGLYRRADDP